MKCFTGWWVKVRSCPAGLCLREIAIRGHKLETHMHRVLLKWQWRSPAFKQRVGYAERCTSGSEDYVLPFTLLSHMPLLVRYDEPIANVHLSQSKSLLPPTRKGNSGPSITTSRSHLCPSHTGEYDAHQDPAPQKCSQTPVCLAVMPLEYYAL